MTTTDMVRELKQIEKDNKGYAEIIASGIASKEQKSECRMKIIENNHQRMHLESVLASIKCDPYF